MNFSLFQINPLTRKRLRRFRAMRRAWWSLWILCVLYALSLGAELISNNRPLYLRFEGRHYFPVFRFYPDDVFTGSGRFTRTDYKSLADDAAFRENPENFMIFPPVPHGPNEIIDPDSLRLPQTVSVRLTPLPRVASITVDDGLVIRRERSAEAFFGARAGAATGRRIEELLPVPAGLQEGLQRRFANESAPSLTLGTVIEEEDETVEIDMSLSSFTARDKPPDTVRIILREHVPYDLAQKTLVFEAARRDPLPPQPDIWQKMSSARQAEISDGARLRFERFVDATTIEVEGLRHRVDYHKHEVRWPHPPVHGHWMGIDGAGRDVLARVIYGLRTSMTFGLLLVAVSVALGIVIGAVQGYFGGRFDLLAQRLIEIWSAIPFLYVMILLGSVFGRSFGLLLVCYGLFNWIGISYYMRAEFLRLRRQPFVEAARGMGLTDRVLLFRHILPNALVPVVTFTPFALVGAINALAALDFLGFGLPPPTASWGELIQQAQQFGWVWWLIFYPGLALFIVMLLGVFIGEGARNAFDPVPWQKLQ